MGRANLSKETCKERSLLQRCSYCLLFQYSIVPLFHHSIMPLIHHFIIPLFQRLTLATVQKSQDWIIFCSYLLYWTYGLSGPVPQPWAEETDTLKSCCLIEILPFSCLKNRETTHRPRLSQIPAFFSLESFGGENLDRPVDATIFESHFLF